MDYHNDLQVHPDHVLPLYSSYKWEMGILALLMNLESWFVGPSQNLKASNVDLVGRNKPGPETGQNIKLNSVKSLISNISHSHK